VLIVLLIVAAISALVYFTAIRDLENLAGAMRYCGVVISSFFIFVCFNELFYEFRLFRLILFWKIRRCEAMSILIAIASVTAAFFVDNWIYSNFMAICICIASIKIFQFASLKVAYISNLILAIAVVLVYAAVHYFSSRKSIDDYARELSSPLFLMFPDIGNNNLFRKCSWLFIVDIIVPGVMISYLRLYDVNRGSFYLGVYTLVGNVTIIVATVLWMTISYFMSELSFSIPFSLINYFALMLVIFIVSWSRNEWKDLWSGMFSDQPSEIHSSKLEEK